MIGEPPSEAGAVQEIPMGFWNEPGHEYFRAAMEDLELREDDLEDVENPHISVTIGDYPTLDCVYARAWEFRAADEGE